MNDQNANDGRKVEMLFGQLQCRPQMKPRARVTCGKPTSLAPGVGLAQFSKCTVHTSALHLAGSPTGDSYAFRTTQTACMFVRLWSDPGDELVPLSATFGSRPRRALRTPDATGAGRCRVICGTRGIALAYRQVTAGSVVPGAPRRPDDRCPQIQWVSELQSLRCRRS